MGRKKLKRKIFRLLKKRGTDFKNRVRLSEALTQYIQNGYIGVERNYDELKRYLKFVNCGCEDPQCFYVSWDWEKIPISREEIEMLSKKG